MGSINVQQTGFALYYIICVDVEHGLPMELIGHGIVAIAAPGMTTEDAADGEIEPFEGAMHLDGFNRVGRAGRCEAACRWEHGRDDHTVEVNGEEEQP